MVYASRPLRAWEKESKPHSLYYRLFSKSGNAFPQLQWICAAHSITPRKCTQDGRPCLRNKRSRARPLRKSTPFKEILWGLCYRFQLSGEAFKLLLNKVELHDGPFKLQTTGTRTRLDGCLRNGEKQAASRLCSLRWKAQRLGFNKGWMPMGSDVLLEIGGGMIGIFAFRI